MTFSSTEFRRERTLDIWSLRKELNSPLKVKARLRVSPESLMAAERRNG